MPKEDIKLKTDERKTPPKVSPSKSPERLKNVTRKRPAARLKTINRSVNQLANARKARAAKVLRNAKAARTQGRSAPSKTTRQTIGSKSNVPSRKNSLSIGAPREVKVYVGNLPENTKKVDVEREFRQIGRIRDVWLAENPPGFAFINFILGRDAARAVRQMNGKHTLGCRLRVEIAKSTGRKSKVPARDRSSRAKSRDRSGRERRLSDTRDHNSRLSESRDRREKTRPLGRELNRGRRPLENRVSIGSRLAGRLGSRRDSQLSPPGGVLNRKGRKKKGGKGKKKRLARLRGRNPPLVQPCQDVPQLYNSPPRYSETPEFRLGSPPRRSSGYDLPPPPPLLPLPPVDLYDVFDSRSRVMEINRYREDPNYRSGDWDQRIPSPMRGMTHTYYARTPSPRPRAMPRTPPPQYRRSLTPPRHADSRTLPESPTNDYVAAYSYKIRGGAGDQRNRSRSPRGWRSRDRLSPPARRPPSPTAPHPNHQWNSPPPNATRWSRSPPPNRVLSPVRTAPQYSRSPVRRPPSPPLPKAYRQHSPSPVRRHRPPSPAHPPPRKWSPQSTKRYHSPDRSGRHSPKRGRSPRVQGRSPTSRRAKTARGHSSRERRPYTPPDRPRSPPRSYSRSPRPTSPNMELRRGSPNHPNGHSNKTAIRRSPNAMSLQNQQNYRDRSPMGHKTQYMDRNLSRQKTYHQSQPKQLGGSHSPFRGRSPYDSLHGMVPVRPRSPRPPSPRPPSPHSPIRDMDRRLSYKRSHSRGRSPLPKSYRLRSASPPSLPKRSAASSYQQNTRSSFDQSRSPTRNYATSAPVRWESPARTVPQTSDRWNQPPRRRSKSPRSPSHRAARVDNSRPRERSPISKHYSRQHSPTHKNKRYDHRSRR